MSSAGMSFVTIGLLSLGQANAWAADPYRTEEVAALNAALLRADSATATLGTWCADHRLATPPEIHAIRAVGSPKPPTAKTLALLGAAQPDVRYRHVRLTCGSRVLSEADNWYRPDRLTPAMNQVLDTTDAPFGAVVKPLGFHRRTLSVRFLPPASGAVLRHRAILTTAGGAPFSVVVETYQSAVLAPLMVTPPDR